MLKLPNGHKYKIVYFDTNAISEISKNKNNEFTNILKYFNFFDSNSNEGYVFATTAFNLIELNKTRDEYKRKIIEKFDLIPMLILQAFPQVVPTEINKDEFIMFGTGIKELFNVQFSTIFNSLDNSIDTKEFYNNLNKEMIIWNKDRNNKKNLKELFISSYAIYNCHNDNYDILYQSKCAKIFSFIKYHFLYEKSKNIDKNSIIDSYNATLAPLVDVYVGERTVSSWLNKSKDKYDFMKNLEIKKISDFFDKN